MKRWLVVGLAFSLVSLAVKAQAQRLEALTNPNVVAGGSYLLEDPGEGLSRAHFLLTANVAGVKIGSAPLYFGGIGIDLRTIDPAFEGIQGIGLSVPVLTYYFKGDQFLAQAGYSRDLSGDVKSNGIYVGFGFSLTSPNSQAVKRAEKAKKAKS